MAVRAIKADGTELVVTCESSEYQIDIRRLQVKFEDDKTTEIQNVISVKHDN